MTCTTHVAIHKHSCVLNCIGYNSDSVKSIAVALFTTLISLGFGEKHLFCPPEYQGGKIKDTDINVLLLYRRRRDKNN